MAVTKVSDLTYEIQLLRKLVGLNTDVSTKSNYTEIVEILKGECDKLGALTQVISAKSDDGKPRPNLVAYFDRGSKHTVAISAHFDALPANKEEGWKTDPFTLTESEGKLIGSGTNDDKGAIAVALGAIRDAEKAPNIELFLTCDEEVGSAYGMEYVADNYSIKSSGAVGLDGDTAIFLGGSGGFGCSITIKGKSYHAGWPFNAVNPIELGIPFLSRMDGFKAIAEKEVSNYSDVGTAKGRKVTGRSVLTMLHAGSAGNLIPNEMTATFNVRCTPEGSVDKILAQFVEFFEQQRKAYLGELEAKGVTSLEISLAEGGKKNNYLTDENADIVKRMQRVTGETQFHASHGGNDASAFNHKGVPAISYGLFNETAHLPNEYVRLGDMLRVKNTLIGLFESY